MPLSFDLCPALTLVRWLRTQVAVRIAGCGGGVPPRKWIVPLCWCVVECAFLMLCCVSDNVCGLSVVSKNFH